MNDIFYSRQTQCPTRCKPNKKVPNYRMKSCQLSIKKSLRTKDYLYPKAWDRQTKGEGNSLSLYLQTLLLVVRKFFIGSREVFCYRFERGIEKNVIFVT